MYVPITEAEWQRNDARSVNPATSYETSPDQFVDKRSAEHTTGVYLAHTAVTNTLSHSVHTLGHYTAEYTNTLMPR